MKVKEADIRQIVRDRLKDNINSFYTDRMLNYEGTTADTKIIVSEVIADELNKNYAQLSKIGKNTLIRRSKPFNCGHKGIANVRNRINKFGELTYNEKCLAIALFNSEQSYCLGKIFDYEVPIKETKNDKYGKVDLVSTHDPSHSIKLIELKIKSERRGETLLRAILEIYTYYKLISGSYDKFIRDYKLSRDLYQRFQPAILTDQESLSGKTLSDIEKYPCIQALLSEMNNELRVNVEGYVYDYPGRNKAFQSNGEISQKIFLEGNITITKII